MRLLHDLEISRGRVISFALNEPGLRQESHTFPTRRSSDLLRFEANLQTASITTSNEDRDNHLRSADFFDAESHPSLTFMSTELKGDKLHGDLTIDRKSVV